MTAPIRHRIELNAMGELHLVFCIESPRLRCSLGSSLCTLSLELLAFLDAAVVNEFVLFDFRQQGIVGRGLTPSSSQSC